MNSKLFTLVCLLCTSSLFAQLNTTLIGNLEYNATVSDVWGYVAPDGTEYALVGIQNGVSVVNLADPANPVESGFLPGASSTWRDLKTFGEYAYVTNETAQGLMVIDLTQLPDAVSATNWTPSIGGVGNNLSSCHNIYIDDAGVAYLAGCNLNGGGMIFVDVATTPGSPELIDVGDARYSHDVYVRDNMMYSSDIGNGFLSVTDISDKNNVNLLATQTTPFNNTHNAWLSDDSQTIFTTDETGNAPVAAYDISDLNDIEFLDEFRPLATIDKGVIPHNVHVLNDYLIISYYTDGCIIVDANRPNNLVEVGNYDTFIGPDGGFSGAWGAYPFLPSGLILISDQSGGLFIVEANYQRAAYLEGNVIDSQTNLEINAATIELLETSVVESSDAMGEYKTGYAIAGTYTVNVSKPGYEPFTTEVTLVNGEVTEQDFMLTPLASFAMTGTVTDVTTGAILSDAAVRIVNEDFSFSTTTNGAGNFTIEQFFAGDYEVFAGRWGYKTRLVNSQTFDENNNSVSLELETGIEDVFSLDLGWNSTFQAFSGEWELANPPLGVFVEQAGTFITPPEDVDSDLGNGCYVTGNSNDLFSGVLTGGLATLESPTFDLTNYNQPVLSCYTWFLSVNGNTGGTGNNKMFIRVSNGSTSVNLDTIGFTGLGQELEWEAHEFNLSNHIELTNEMTVSFVIPTVSNPNIVEAGVDFFQVVEGDATNIFDLQLVDYQMNITPNPSADVFQLNYELPTDSQQQSVQIYNAIGQLVEQITVNASTGSLTFGEQYATGIYLVQMTTDQGAGQALKVVKK